MKIHSESGFTLAEMMVALFVFGLIASGAVLLLRFSVDSEISSRNRLEEIADMRRFTAVLNADLAQAVPRPSRDMRGLRRNAFETRDDMAQSMIMRLTRGGWTNFEGTARPSLQLVEYHLENGVLERRSQPMLDGSAASAGGIVTDGVTGAKMRFRDSRGVWSDEWEPQLPEALPVAVEMTLSRSANGIAQPPMQLVVLVGANY